MLPVLLLQWLLRNALADRISLGRIPATPRRAFLAELAVFVVGGAIIGVINTAAHGFPASSGFKAMLGFVAIGAFAGLDQALVRVRERFLEGGLPAERREPPLSLASRVGLGLAATLVLLLAVVSLLVVRAIDDGTIADPAGFRRLAIEFGFVLAAILGYVAFFARTAGAVLQQAVSEQVSTLSEARLGRGRRRALVGTRDEIGFVSGEINRLLDSLEQAETIAERTNHAVIRSLIGLAGARDSETGAHLLRTQRYVAILCDVLATDPDLAKSLDPETIALITAAAPLHDIGKVAVPDAILLKPGRLTEAEFEVMKTHVVHGISVIDTVIAEVAPTPFLAVARDIIAGHHENYDGKGYPAGLAGNAIPLAGRIMALSDVYDALRSPRIYKPALSHADARRIIIEGAGTRFEPRVVAAFLLAEPEFDRVATSMADPVPLGGLHPAPSAQSAA